jgi:hypothetical protein
LDASSAMPKSVKLVMREAAGRSWKHLAVERIEGVEPVIPIGNRFWPLTQDERAAVDALIADEMCGGSRRLFARVRTKRRCG